MTAAALLSDLRRRGVKLSAEGDQLRYRAPRGTLRPADLEALRIHKLELLAELSQARAEDLAAAPIAEARLEPGAVLIASPKYGEIWVALARRPRPALAYSGLVDSIPRVKGSRRRD